jgi:F-type H+-transporting ATPase subunit delta
MSQLARRYAKAILEVAKESNSVDAVKRGLDDFDGSWAASKELRMVFESPEVGANERKNVLEAIATRMGLPQSVTRLLSLLSDRRRMRFVPEVVSAFHTLSESEANTSRVEVITATPMPDSYYAEIQRAIEAASGQKVVLEKREDPSILGGVITKMAGRVLDGSLRTRLGELGDQLLER